MYGALSCFRPLVPRDKMVWVSIFTQLCWLVQTHKKPSQDELDFAPDPLFSESESPLPPSTPCDDPEGPSVLRGFWVVDGAMLALYGWHPGGGCKWRTNIWPESIVTPQYVPLWTESQQTSEQGYVSTSIFGCLLLMCGTNRLSAVASTCAGDSHFRWNWCIVWGGDFKCWKRRLATKKYIFLGHHWQSNCFCWRQTNLWLWARTCHDHVICTPAPNYSLSMEWSRLSGSTVETGRRTKGRSLGNCRRPIPQTSGSCTEWTWGWFHSTPCWKMLAFWRMKRKGHQVMWWINILTAKCRREAQNMLCL